MPTSISLYLTSRSLGDEALVAFLGIAPARRWNRGDRKRAGRLEFASRYRASGVRYALPARQRRASFAAQQRHWIRFLADHRRGLRRAVRAGVELDLDVFVADVPHRLEFAAGLIAAAGAAGASITTTCYG